MDGFRRLHLGGDDQIGSRLGQSRIECAAPFAERAQNTISIQTCLVRCAARSAALGAANVTGTMVMPTPQTPWTSLPGNRRRMRY